ncbi:hypothetical protein M2140_000390 [Clostridiales Family XIII bacterium PM5-7]
MYEFMGQRTKKMKREAMDALERLRERGEIITFPAVARECGYSSTFLYRHDDLKAAIIACREEYKNEQ